MIPKATTMSCPGVHFQYTVGFYSAVYSLIALCFSYLHNTFILLQVITAPPTMLEHK